MLKIYDFIRVKGGVEDTFISFLGLTEFLILRPANCF